MRSAKSFKRGQVYAALFSDGLVKVGRGRVASDRITVHVGSSKIRGATLIDSAVSGVMFDTVSAEKRLIDYCAQSCSERYSGEWFKGVDMEKIVEIIDSEFCGETPEPIKNIIKAENERFKSAISHILKSETLGRQVSDCEKWSASMSHASVMSTMYGGWMYGGDLFAPLDGGPSKFQLFSALALYGMSTEEIADAYITITDDPDEGISFLMSAAEKSARSILAAEKIEPEKALEVSA